MLLDVEALVRLGRQYQAPELLLLLDVAGGVRSCSPLVLLLCFLPGGRGKGKGFADQWDSLEPLAAPTLKRVMTHTGDGDSMCQQSLTLLCVHCGLHAASQLSYHTCSTCCFCLTSGAMSCLLVRMLR
jgi:hypothetical protein